MNEGHELHGVDQGLKIFNFIGYYWLDEYAMQALGSSVS